MLSNRISLEIQTTGRISFRVYDLRKIKDGYAHNHGMDGPKTAKSNDLARCFNALALVNMQYIASGDILNELVNDYFVTHPIGNDDSDSDLSDSSEDDFDPELAEEVNGSVNGDSQTVYDDPRRKMRTQTPLFRPKQQQFFSELTTYSWKSLLPLAC